MHKTSLINEHVFGQHTIGGCAAQGLAHLFGCNATFQPFRVENRLNAIANLDARDAVSRGRHDAHAVREENTRDWRSPSAHAVDNKQVAIVERKSVHL